LIGTDGVEGFQAQKNAGLTRNSSSSPTIITTLLRSVQLHCSGKPRICQRFGLKGDYDVSTAVNDVNPIPAEKVPMPALVIRFFLPVVLIMLVDCAGQIPPDGGARDTEPPVISSTIPENNAVRIGRPRITLVFSKYVDRRTVEESIFISPYVGQLEFDWSGREVTITFSQPLREHTTYVVNVGTDVREIREKIRMASAFTLAFSTGDSIDQGLISGRVYDEKPDGVMVFAYAIDGINPDTLDPAHVRPDYIIQTGKDGRFVLSNIGLRPYRIFAIRDEYRNLIYDREVDQFGVSRGDVTLLPGHEVAGEMDFRLWREDTTAPFITRVQALNNRRLEVRFSEPLDTARFAAASITVVDTTSGKETAVQLSYLDRLTRTVAGVLLADQLDSVTWYRLYAQRIFDAAGNEVNPDGASFVFDGTAVKDTLSPRLSFPALKDSARGVPFDKPVEIRFDEPVLPGPLEQAVVLLDSGGTVVPTTLEWLGATDALIRFERSLLTHAWYTLRVALDSVRDHTGNTYEDTTAVLRFQTLDLRTTGTIEGILTDEVAGEVAPYYITAASVGATPEVRRTIRIAQPGAYGIDRLPEGRYTLEAFVDSDGSGSYSYGLPFPFVPSERFAVNPDTLRVRARWSVEGVAIRLK
jgi:hypothetical protein